MERLDVLPFFRRVLHSVHKSAQVPHAVLLVVIEVPQTHIDVLDMGFGEVQQTIVDPGLGDAGLWMP